MKRIEAERRWQEQKVHIDRRRSDRDIAERVLRPFNKRGRARVVVTLRVRNIELSGPD